MTVELNRAQKGWITRRKNGWKHPGLSEEIKQRMRERVLKRWANKDWAEAERVRRRKGHSEETKQKQRKAMIGFKHSDETKKRISEMKRASPTTPRGPNHPRWNGGPPYEGYPPEFNDALKRRIRERDNHTCQKCGRTEAEEKVEIGQVLSTHHIYGNKQDIEEINLIALCLRCNLEVSRDPEKWQPFFTELIRGGDVQ